MRRSRDEAPAAALLFAETRSAVPAVREAEAGAARGNRIVAWLAVLGAAAVLIALLFGRTFVGVADNGDFSRLMWMVGLYHYPEPAADLYFSYAHAHFAYGAWLDGQYAYLSAQVLPAAAASLLGMLAGRGSFDIRMLGALYAAMLLAAIWLLVRYQPLRSRIGALMLAAAIVFVFADIGYAAYFNSFFGEPFALTTTLLAAAFGLAVARQGRPDRRMLAAFFAAALCLAASKIQNAPVGVLLGLLTFRFAALHAAPAWRRTAIAMGALLIGVSVILYAAAPQQLKHINLYQTVFFGILKDSPDPAADLRELGLPESLAVNAGTNYFQTGTVIPQNDPRLAEPLAERVSHADVALFYLRHPARFVQKLSRAAENGFSIRPYYLGNFEKEAGRGPGALDERFSGWSAFKTKVVPHKLGFVLGCFVLWYAALLSLYLRRKGRKERLYLELLAAFGLIGLFSFMVPLIGDGEADLGKHLFQFNVIFDGMALAAWGYLWHWLPPLRRAAKQ